MRAWVSPGYAAKAARAQPQPAKLAVVKSLSLYAITQDVFRKIQDLYLHDVTIHSVLENAEDSSLTFQIDCPINWEKNEFELAYLTFIDVVCYKVLAIPFSGKPCILDYEFNTQPLECTTFVNDYISIIMKTNAGDRYIAYRDLKLEWKKPDNRTSSFYLTSRDSLYRFLYNDSVMIKKGPNKGINGTIVSVKSPESGLQYVVETSEAGDIVVSEFDIELV